MCAGLTALLLGLESVTVADMHSDVVTVDLPAGCQEPDI